MTTLGPRDPRARRSRLDTEPLPLLADQYFDRLTSRASDMPEKRLMLAVLFDAVTHLHRRGSVAATEVRRWIQAESSAPFAFNSICEAFGIEPVYLARGLLSWQGRFVHRVHGRFSPRSTRAMKAQDPQ